MPRTQASRSEIEFDRYDDRRSRNGGRSRYEEDDIDIQFRRGSGAAPVRERVVYKERDEVDSRGPSYLRDNYGKSSTAGPLVLRKRETEDFDVVRRRRSPSPEIKREEERIIIKRDQSRGPPPRRRAESVEREEIIIRRDERESSRPPRRRAESVEREEIIIRRDERESVAPPRRNTRYDDREEEKIIIKRTERDNYRPARSEIDRKETIILEDDNRSRARSRVRYQDEEEEDDEIIIRREERERGGHKHEIIIRHQSRSRSPTPEPIIEPEPVVEPPPRQIVYAPEIHQEVVTHHRHIDHGFDVQLANKRRDEYVYSRPPSPPSPPPRRERSEERIEIRRTETRNGRREEEDIIIDRRDRSEPPPRREERKEETLEIDFRRGGFEEERERSSEAIIANRFGRQRDPTEGLWTEVTKDLVVKEAIQEMGYEYQETEEFYYIFKYMKYADVAHLVGLSEDIRKNRYKRINEIRWENEFAPQPALEAPPRRLAIEGPRRAESPRFSEFSRRDDRYASSDRRRDDFERDEERYIEREVVYRGGRPPPPVGWRR